MTERTTIRKSKIIGCGIEAAIVNYMLPMARGDCGPAGLNDPACIRLAKRRRAPEDLDTPCYTDGSQAREMWESLQT